MNRCKADSVKFVMSAVILAFLLLINADLNCNTAPSHSVSYQVNIENSDFKSSVAIVHETVRVPEFNQQFVSFGGLLKFSLENPLYSLLKFNCILKNRLNYLDKQHLKVKPLLAYLSPQKHIFFKEKDSVPILS